MNTLNTIYQHIPFPISMVNGDCSFWLMLCSRDVMQLCSTFLDKLSSTQGHLSWVLYKVRVGVPFHCITHTRKHTTKTALCLKVARCGWLGIRGHGVSLVTCCEYNPPYITSLHFSHSIGNQYLIQANIRLYNSLSSCCRYDLCIFLETNSLATVWFS